MENRIYKLTIDKVDFDIDYIKFIDICCLFIEPKKRANKKSSDLNIQTDNTKGVYRLKDLFDASYSISILAKYLKQYHDTILFKDMSDYYPEDIKKGDKYIVAFSDADNYAFMEIQEAFAQDFLKWAGEQFYFNEYKDECKNSQIEYQALMLKMFAEVCGKLNVSEQELDKALGEIFEKKPLGTLATRIVNACQNPTPKDDNEELLKMLMQNLMV